MFSHGGAVGGLNTSIGTLGFSAAPAFSVNGSDVTTMPGLLAGGSGAIPAFTGATGVASGPAYGTGYLATATLGATTGTPSSMTYDDPYYGGRAPEFENWSFGIQQQLTNSMALNITYVGSEGHFLQLDSFHARGFAANDLDPKYLLPRNTSLRYWNDSHNSNGRLRKHSLCHLLPRAQQLHYVSVTLHTAQAVPIPNTF